jgi:Lipocalin-like domain
VVSGTVNGEGARRLHGAWRYLGSNTDGKPTPGRGANPKGIIYYDPSGSMVVQVAPDKERAKAGARRRARFRASVRRAYYKVVALAARFARQRDSAPTPDEAQAALAGYIAYFGTYTVDEKAATVTHHRHASVQPGDVADLVRGYEFAGDRLILRPPGTTYEVVWERIK